MTISLQVAYPTTEGTSFDYDYYFSTHMEIVNEHFGPHLQSATASKGIAGGPDTPSPFYAIATLVFADQAALDAALAAGAPVIGDIPKFTDTQPQMMIGEVVIS